MKIATVVGARPQFVKAAVLSRVLREKTALREVLIHTGQHYDEMLSAIFFKEMEISTPDYHLGIGNLSPGALTGRMVEALETVLLKEKPDWVVVYGDTHSTLAGALAAMKLHIPLAHVEAGLRSYNRKMPEEMNRILTDHASERLFTPTEMASQTLLKEGICPSKIEQVGDIMYDAVLYYKEKAFQKSTLHHRLNLKPQNYALATLHRAENTEDPHTLHTIFQALKALANQMQVVVPLHPRTRKALHHLGQLDHLHPLQILDPLGYFDMLALESQAQLILTDSGGVQKEAYFFKVPCLTLRKETEWTELLTHRFNTVIGHSLDAILDHAHTAVNHVPDWNIPLYGNGKTGEKIALSLEKMSRNL